MRRYFKKNQAAPWGHSSGSDLRTYWFCRVNRTHTSEFANPVRPPSKHTRSLTETPTQRHSTEAPDTPPHTHTTLAHGAICRSCLHLRVGQHNSPNRYDTKNYHTSRCTHEKLAKIGQKQCTTGVLGRCQNTHKNIFP